MLRRQPKTEPFWARVRHSIRRRFLSGLLVLIPAGVTLLVLRFLYNFTAGRLSPVVKQFMPNYPDYLVVPASIIILFILLYLVGLGASVFIGRKLIGVTEALIQRIPLVKTVYNASKQMMETLSFQNQGTDFKTAVFVNFPSPQLKALGFITGKILLADGKTYYKIFIPTTPNISIGLLELVSEQGVYRCNLVVEDAIKAIVSAGILCPPRLQLIPIAHAPAELGTASDDDDEE